MFPAYKEGQPCCYKEKRATEVIAKDESKDDTYILGTSNLPERRLGFLSEQLARSLHVKTSYSTSVPKKRIEAGNADVFRIGVGRPSKTLPLFLKDTTPIPAPDKAVAAVVEAGDGAADGDTNSTMSV